MYRGVRKQLTRAWNTLTLHVVEPAVEAVAPRVSSALETAGSVLEPVTRPVTSSASYVVNRTYDTLYPIPQPPVGYKSIYRTFPYCLVYPTTSEFNNPEDRNEALTLFLQNPIFRQFLAEGRLLASPSTMQSQNEKKFIEWIQNYQSYHTSVQPGALLNDFVVAALNAYQDNPLPIDLIVIYGLSTQHDALIARLYDSVRVGGGPRDRLKNKVLELYNTPCNQELIKITSHNKDSLLYHTLELHRYPLSLPALLGHSPATLSEMTGSIRESETQRNLRASSRNM